MLLGISIRDIVLIDKLDISFDAGLCTLTGETGAGKSILLDSLGLTLGMRADSGLVRHGARQGSVSAEFAIDAAHPAHGLLSEQALDESESLVLRRMVGADGRSRAFVNDQPVSVGLLRQIGETLVEIHGQGEEHGLLNPATHRGLLDQFGGLDGAVAKARDAYAAMRQASEAATQAAVDLAASQADEAYLRHVVGELEALDPRPGEEEELAETRAYLMNSEKLADGLNEAVQLLEEGETPERRLQKAQTALERVAMRAGGRLDPVLEVLDRALVEAGEAYAAVSAALHDLELEPTRLEQVEERLFALRDAARKHSVTVDELADLKDNFIGQLAAVTDGAERVARLQAEAEACRGAYAKAAEALSAKRAKAAKRLDKAVAQELPPLKLNNARFATKVTALAESDWGPEGCDGVAFTVATNAGTPPGPIAKVASGGELSRFMLALKVVLARQGSAPCLIFDEVDRGIGGATADAVGERLARLAGSHQVLVVTHSPQVAARGDHHWRVAKRENGKTVTTVERLDTAQRGEEIARMLAGAEVTQEARAAAESLLAGQRP